jgi:flagellar biosynthesis protein FliQ
VLLALLLSGPPLLAALAVGLATGALQAATQVHDAALGVVPRMVAVLAAVALSAPWAAARAARFAAACLDLLPRVGS